MPKDLEKIHNLLNNSMSREEKIQEQIYFVLLDILKELKTPWYKRIFRNTK